VSNSLTPTLAIERSLKYSYYRLRFTSILTTTSFLLEKAMLYRLRPTFEERPFDGSNPSLRTTSDTKVLTEA
jgi:hypothetical protein